ncbi:Chondroitin polymerase [Leclercia adecarboxylata]|uniref:glycosyltransferase family 2 protein n=1 Tax=Leclercia adecarboxylata TaxID=83655 RepID=UPI000D874E97|nr:glycosyltransferase family 2 protein [Leclercia adecarboxylata]SPX65289.1 Chondroitin polymerase [Leclercia adecarboxylata]
MKFTLAIITFNAAATINKCLDSCVSQSYKDLDIIIVDDNSSDNTIEIIQNYMLKDKRINLIRHTKNKSALQARKNAVKHAQSQYIWFIDSDDHIVHSAVGELSRALKANNYPDMLTFGSNDYNEIGDLKRQFFDWGTNKTLREWKFDSDYRPYTRITKTEILKKAADIIPNDLYLYRHNDFFMFNLVKLFTGSKAFLERALYNYTLSSTSVTNQKNNDAISRHVELIDILLLHYASVAKTINQQEVDINSFVNSQKIKLKKYAINQYQSNPSTYLHTLKKLYKYDNKIIISLTTYSKRIQTVYKTIESLLKQTLLADKIILWLDENEITRSNLPQNLTVLESDVFEIRFCPNYKSYKKLIPTLQLYPDATIVTFDDDVYYPSDHFEKLFLKHLDNPNEIITHVARNILFKDGELLPYGKWAHVFKAQVGQPQLHLLPIGVGGVLYPTNALHPEVTNITAFMNLAPHGDDLWFKCMSLLNDRKVIALNHGYQLAPNQIAGTQDVGLWQNVNESSDSNKLQLCDILKAYPEISARFSSTEFSSQVVHNVDYCKLLQEIKTLSLENSKLKKQKNTASTINPTQSKNKKATLKDPKSNGVNQINGEFDEEWYVTKYPDVLKTILKPIEHYNLIGKKLNRLPRPDA